MIKKLFIATFLLFASFYGMYSQIVEISYQDWHYDCVFKPITEKFIVNSKEDLDSISKCILLNYDFNNNTIIGVQGTSQGYSQPIVDFRILKDIENKKYIIEAKIFGGTRSNLRNIHPKYKRVIVTDKLQSDYSIDFIKQEIYDN